VFLYLSQFVCFVIVAVLQHSTFDWLRKKFRFCGTLIAILSKSEGRYSDSLRDGRSGDRIPTGASCPTPVQPGLGHAQPPIQWVPGLSWGVKRPGPGADHRTDLYSHLWACMALYRVNFTCSQNHIVAVLSVIRSNRSTYQKPVFLASVVLLSSQLHLDIPNDIFVVILDLQILYILYVLPIHLHTSCFNK
jgi:hypothetical protein